LIQPPQRQGFFYYYKMARPVKNYCDYFTHDRDMRNHRKIKALRTKFGITGYALWNMLLEYLTGIDGNEFEFSEIEIELMAGDFGVSVTEISDVVNYCVKMELLFLKDGFINSESLDERLNPVYEKRKVAKSLSKKQLRSNGKYVNNNAASVGVSVTEMPQSKVKESKVKESIITHPNNLENSNLYRKPNIPTKAQVWECFSLQGGTREMAKVFFDNNEGTGWFYKNSPITNFANLVPSFISNWKKFENKNAPADSNSLSCGGTLP